MYDYMNFSLLFSFKFCYIVNVIFKLFGEAYFVKKIVSLISN